MRWSFLLARRCLLTLVTDMNTLTFRHCQATLHATWFVWSILKPLSMCMHYMLERATQFFTYQFLTTNAKWKSNLCINHIVWNPTFHMMSAEWVRKVKKRNDSCGLVTERSTQIQYFQTGSAAERSALTPCSIWPRQRTVIRWIWRTPETTQLDQDELAGALCQSHITLIKTNWVRSHTFSPSFPLTLQVMNSSACTVYHPILLNFNVTAQFSQRLYWSYSRVTFLDFNMLDKLGPGDVKKARVLW